MTSLKSVLCAALVVASLALAAPASANPKKLPLSYGPITVPEGDLEWETIIDMVPMRVPRELPDGTLEGVTTPRYILTTELEYGLTDRIELGMYLMWRQGASAETPLLRFEGVKQRLRWRLSDPGEWPVDVALYLEVAELREELEFEQKLILRRQVGPLDVVANLWVEQEWYWIEDDVKYVYNPTLGASYEITPSVNVGLEYWARGRFDDAAAGASAEDDTPVGTHHYLGPTLMLQKGEYWLATGAYVRLDGLGDSIATGDPYGRVWVRLILGVGL